MFKKMHAGAQQVSQIVVGKELQVRQALTCLLAGGHLLVLADHDLADLARGGV